MDSPYHAEFYRLLYQAGPSQLAGVLANFAAQGEQRHLDGLIEMLEHDVRKAHGVAQLRSWLVNEESMPVQERHRLAAREKYMLRSEAGVALEESPAVVLAMTFWPREPLHMIFSHELAMETESLVRIERLGRVLQDIQAVGQVRDGGPFDQFLSACFSGVRNRRALDSLVALVAPAERQDLWTALRHIRRRDGNRGKEEKILADIALLDCNAPAVACCLAQDAASSAINATALATRVLKGEHKVVDRLAMVLIKECRSSAEPSPGSFMASLQHVGGQISEAQQARLSQQMLQSVMVRLCSTLRPSFAATALERLWTHRPACLDEQLRGNELMLQAFLTAAAGSSFLPALESFKQDIVAACESDQPWISKMVLKMAQHACHKTSQVAQPAFEACVRHMISCGCALEKLRFDNGNTLLHCLAVSELTPRTAPVMMALTELGCDPKAKNANGRTPTTVMPKGPQREEWLTLLRSHEAREAATQSLFDIDEVPVPRPA